MKQITIFLTVLLPIFIARGGELLPKGKEFHPLQLEIVWAAPTNQLPVSLWIYKNVPTEFSARAISNLMAVGSFTMQDLRKLSPDEAAIDKNGLAFQNETERRYLGISPALGLVTYQDQKANDMMKPVEGVPSVAKVKKQALNLLDQIEISRSDLATKSVKKDDFLTFGDSTTRGHFDEVKKKPVKEIDERGIFFVRKINGVNFAGIGVAGGFHVDYTSHGKIASLELVWRNLQPFQQYTVASPKKIMSWIKEGKGIFPYPLANPDLDPAAIKKLTITEYTPLYKGALGDEPEAFTPPFAQINAVADVGGTNLNIQIYCPILSTNTVQTGLLNH